jgi:hypothetical protein
MNYKLVHKPGNWQAIPNTKGKYVTQLYDIVETKTGHVVATKPGFHDEAKRLCHHLNSGGGFNGNTPEFFLKSVPPIKWSHDELTSEITK